MAENFFGITDIGKERSNNEDTFIAESGKPSGNIIACVIDGVGGYDGGEIASGLARQAILDQLKKKDNYTIGLLKDALIQANAVVYKERQLSSNNNQMACVATLAIADIENNKLFFAHVGDTRLYLYRDHTLVKISHDHSFVGFLEDSGRLTEAEAMNHAKRNEINKALGFSDTIEADDYIETGESPFLPGDVILLCSDGLTDLVDRSAMVNILNTDATIEGKGAQLIEAANNAGGKDNITVVLVKNHKTAVTHTATKPSAAVAAAGVQVKKEAIQSEYKSPESMQKPIAKKSSAVPVLSILLILLLAAFIYLFYQYYTNKGQIQPGTTSGENIDYKKTQRELNFIDSINSPFSKEVFIINTPGDQPISISDSIFISKDSLHIIGNGATLMSGGNFKGAAFITSLQAKYILLDSLTLENFDVAILTRNNSIHFKNVRFKNCKVPVQYNFAYPNDSPVNGHLVDTTYSILQNLPLH